MIGKIIEAMIEVNAHDARRISHALKVYALTQTIAEAEIAEEFSRECAIIASILHDIGIHASEEKYQSSAGKYQEIEGPPIAREILSELDYAEDIIARVCFIIAKHHTYSADFGIDHQVLVEADLIVNLEEEKSSSETIMKTRDKLYKTPTGIHLLKQTLL